MKIVTEFWAKPIPLRQFDWSAVTDDYEPGCPIGYGRTRQEAIDDLLEQLNDTEMQGPEHEEAGPVGEASSSARRDDGRIRAPAISPEMDEPDDWLECARRAFAKRWHEEMGQ